MVTPAGLVHELTYMLHTESAAWCCWCAPAYATSLPLPPPLTSPVHCCAVLCSCVCCVLAADYHPDKHERMKAVFRYYVQKDMAALASFPGGSEPGT